MDELVRNFVIVSVFAALPVAAWFSFLALAKRLSENPPDRKR
jgi:hypothetical protein